MNELKSVVIFFMFSLAIVSTNSCFTERCNLGFIEKVSTIEIPENVKIIECKDNWEFITTVIFKIDKEDINRFINQNGFTQVSINYKSEFVGMEWLSKDNLQFPNAKRLLKIENRTMNNTWYFLIDSETGTVWCEVQYPDWSGTPP